MTANTGDDNLDERVRALEARLDDLLRRRDVPAPNMRDLRDSDLTKVKDGESPTYSILTGRFGPGRVGRGTVSQSVLGFDRADVGVAGGNPQILLEDAGVVFGMANVAGAIVWFLPGAGKMTLTSAGNLSVIGAFGAATYQSADFTGPYINSGGTAGTGFIDFINRNDVANPVITGTGMTGQTGDLFRLRTSTGVVLANVTAAGHINGQKLRGAIYRNADYTIAPNVEQVIAFDLGTGTGVSASGGQFTVGSVGGEFGCTSTVKLKMENLTASAITVKDTYAHLKLNHASGASARVIDDFHIPPFVLPGLATIEVSLPLRREIDLVPGDVLATIAWHIQPAASVTVTVLGAATAADGIYRQSWLDLTRRV